MKNKILIVNLIAIIFLFSARAEAIWNPFKNWEISTGSSEYYKEREEIKSQLDKLVSACESRNLAGFMRKVDEDYFLDKDILESNLRRNLSKYSFIRIDYVINNYVKSSDDKYSVSVNYSRMRENRRTGKMISDYGTTSFIFKKENNKFKLLKMNRPYLF